MDKNPFNKSSRIRYIRVKIPEESPPPGSAPLLPKNTDLSETTELLPKEQSADLFTDIPESSESKLKKFVLQIEQNLPEESLDSLITRIEDSPSFSRSAVNEIIDKRITGNIDAFVRLIDVLLEKMKYVDAFLICLYAQEVFHHQSIDIYAPLIMAGTLSEQRPIRDYVLDLIRNELCEPAVKPNLSRQTYAAVCAFFWSEIRVKKGEQPDLSKEALLWVKDWIKYDRTDEIGYFWEAQILLLNNKHSAAENSLKKCIYDAPEPERDTRGKRRCPRCCRLFLENFLLKTGSDDQIFDIAVRGLHDCIILNPGEKAEYSQYFECLAEDICIKHKNISERKDNRG